MSVAPAAAPEAPVYRMKDLCELTGLSRQAIHFYVQQGLLAEGRKTGRNMAYYGPEHVERLQLIRRLQDERYLPLKAIRALLDGETADLAPAQRRLLAEVGARVGAGLGGRALPTMHDAHAAAAERGVPEADLLRGIELGLLAVRTTGDRLEISSESLWLLDLWSQFRALGFSAELGFAIDDLQIYEQAVATMFKRETELVVGRLDGLPADKLAIMIERALPLIHAIVVHLHSAAVRNLFVAIEPNSRSTP